MDDVYGSAIYGVKTNNIDHIRVKMNATVPENYRLEKMEVQRGDSSSAVNKLSYEYNTVGGEDVTVIYVFSRPNLSISTNNEPDENGNPTKPKGSVSVVTPDGEIIGLKETDKKQSIRFDAGKELKLSVHPMVKQAGSDYDGPDYELDYIRVTDSTGKKVMYRATDFAADGTLTIGEFSKDIDVLVQFREVEGDEKATVFVNKYFIDGENNVYPLTEKCSVTVYGENNSSAKPLKLGSVKDSTFALTTESEMTLEASPGTTLRFTLGEESGFRLADNPFRAEYSNNGSTPVAISATNSGSIWNISSDYVVNNAVISVDVYYLPTYRVHYHGNNNDSGSEPTDTHEYVSGDILGSAEHPLQGKGSLVRRGFTFDGWSTESGDSNSAAKVTEVTFHGMDIDLYAIWTPKDPLHVTYDGNGNTAGTAPVDSETYYYDEPVKVLGRNGMEKTVNGVTYEFAGWNTDRTAQTALYKEYDATQQNADGKFRITQDTTLYAVWLAQYHVTYHDSFNTPPSDDNVYHSGDDVTVLGTTGVEKTVKGVKYRFDGWDTSDSADTALYIPGDAAKGKFNITGNTDLYAVWTINSPKVTYRLTVPSDVTYTVPSEKNYEYGAPVNVADIPTESDYDPLKYTFHGWNTTSTDLNMNEAGTSFTMPDHNVEFTGYFTENGKVNLSYNANGGTPADKVPDSISRHTKIETTVADMSEECVKKGHSFDHWNTAANGLGDKNYYAGDPITVESSDIVLYAQWKKNNYTVEYYGLKKGETDEKLLKQVNYPYSEATEIGGVTLDEIPGKVFT